MVDESKKSEHWDVSAAMSWRCRLFCFEGRAPAVFTVLATPPARGVMLHVGERSDQDNLNGKQ